MLSLELQILIECCKISLLQTSTEKLLTLIEQNKLDWDRLKKMAAYHNIRPVVHNVFRSIPVENEFTIYIKKFTLSQTIYNLNHSLELSKILKLLNSNNIRVLPYKGVLFQAELYNNKSLRESGDIDIFVHPDDAKTALALLLNVGYSFSVDEASKSLSDDILINKVVDAYGRNEVGLEKTNKNGLLVSIDFHWALYVNYFDYNIDEEDFFYSTRKNKEETHLLPSNQNMFIMLLTHHGARNCWLTLKYLCDLLMMIKAKGNQLNWQELESAVEKARMKRSMVLGMHLLEQQFDIRLSDYNAPEFKQKISSGLIKQILNFWESSVHFVTLKPRIKYERILVKMQDEGFSTWGYFKRFSKYYSYSTYTQAQEPKMIASMPEKPTIFNLVSKTITYFYHKSTQKNKN